MNTKKRTMNGILRLYLFRLVMILMLGMFCSQPFIVKTSAAPQFSPEAETVYVDLTFNPSDPEIGITKFLTIQSAVDAVDLGGTVQVAAGVYTERVLISRQLTLNGAKSGIDARDSGLRSMPAEESIIRPDIFIANSNENLITVHADNVMIDGFTLDGNNPELGAQGVPINGVYLHIGGGIANGTYEGDHFATEVSGLQVWNNIIKNFNLYGITISSDLESPRGDHHIEQNLFDNMANGVSPNGASRGIIIQKNQYASVVNNKMTRVRVGLDFNLFTDPNPGAPITITGNDISSVRDGIWIHELGGGVHSISFVFQGNTLRSDPDSTVNTAIRVNWVRTDTLLRFVDNTITSNAKIGIQVYDFNAIHELRIEGGSITGPMETGLDVSNVGDNDNESRNLRIVLDGVAFSGAQTGIKVLDSDLPSTFVSSLSVTVMNDSSIIESQTGISVSGSDATINVVNNDNIGISDNTIGIHVYNQGRLSVTGNRIHSNSSAGVKISDEGRLTQLAYNFITANHDGVIILDTLSQGQISIITNNDLSGNTNLAINNTTGTRVTAGGNWWGGSASGDVDAKASPDVDYSPWLNLGTDSSTAPGFQGDFSSLSVDDILAETSASAIQEGIDMAASGGTVFVNSGAYPGMAQVNRDVILTFANSVTLEGNFSQSVGTIHAPAGNLFFEGNFLRSGGTFLHHSGTVRFLGSILQNVGGSSATVFNNLSVDNDAGVTLAGNLNVDQALTMNSTLLDVSTFRLDLAAAASLSGTGFSSANMVVTGGGGSVCKGFTGPGSFDFPVGDKNGNTNYTPATMQLTGGSYSNGKVCVGVVDARYPYNFAVNHLTRYWTISTPGISNLGPSTLSVLYAGDVEDVVGEKSVMKLLSFNNSSHHLEGDFPGANPLVFHPNAASFNGTAFTAGNLPSPMSPPELVVTRTGAASVLVRWTVANESSNAVYTVLRAETVDGPRITVGSVSHPPLNSPYQIPDNLPLPSMDYYYWLQVDVPGDQDSLFGPYTITMMNIYLPITVR